MRSTSVAHTASAWDRRDAALVLDVEFSVSSAVCRHFFGVASDAAGGLHWLSDNTVLYPVGHSVALYNTETKVQRFVHASPESLAITAVAVTPNRKYLAVGEQADKCTVVLYDLASLKRRKVLVSSLGTGKVRMLAPSWVQMPPSMPQAGIGHGLQRSGGPLQLVGCKLRGCAHQQPAGQQVSCRSSKHSGLPAGCGQHGVQRRWAPAGGPRRCSRLHAHCLGLGEGQERGLPAHRPRGDRPPCLPGVPPPHPPPQAAHASQSRVHAWGCSPSDAPAAVSMSALLR